MVGQQCQWGFYSKCGTCIHIMLLYLSLPEKQLLGIQSHFTEILGPGPGHLESEELVTNFGSLVYGHISGIGILVFLYLDSSQG